MKIEHKNRGMKVTNINEIAAGEVFIYDDEYYIPSSFEDNNGDLMCVNLQTGDTVYFSDNREYSFTIVKAKLVILED